MKYWLYIPENLDIDRMLAISQFEQIPGFSKDYLNYILNCIVEIPSKKKDLDEEYIPLNSKILQHWLGRYYTKYIQLLLDNNIIETDNYYINGIKSKGYKYSGEFDGEIKKVLITDTTLIKKMQNCQHTFYDEFESCEFTETEGFADNRCTVTSIRYIA